jgi:hypothetical protein
VITLDAVEPALGRVYDPWRLFDGLDPLTGLVLEEAS